MSNWASIQSGRDLSADHLDEAIESRLDVRSLFERLAEVTRPGNGGARALLVFVRMASADCEWLEGGLRVDIVEKDGALTVDTFTDIGGGLKERVLPTFSLRCPLSELVSYIASEPSALAPLRATRPSPDRLQLSADEVEKVDHDDESEPPPPRVDPKKTQVSIAHLPTIAVAHLPTVDARDDLPPVSELKPGEIPPPIEFDELESKPGSAPMPPPPKPLARIALKKQITHVPVVEEAPVHSPGRSEDVDDDEWK